LLVTWKVILCLPFFQVLKVRINRMNQNKLGQPFQVLAN